MRAVAGEAALEQHEAVDIERVRAKASSPIEVSGDFA